MKDRMSTEILPDIECACATVRRAARLVTQLYDEEFRGISKQHSLRCFRRLSDKLASISRRWPMLSAWTKLRCRET